MYPTALLWALFAAVVTGLLALDLGVFHRKAHDVSLKEAMAWSVVWVSLALLFDLAIFLVQGHRQGLEFLAAYIIEESLSVDNLFVFLVIFRYFCVPGPLRHRVLFWGIIGAVVMRAVFIGAGITLLERFHWVVYLFGGFLVLTGIKMALKQDEDIHPERNIILRFIRRYVTVEHDYSNGRFFVRRDGRLTATTLFVVLLVVETSDLVFAVDSVPAVLAITRDPFLAYTSNIFAIMGLRSMYFALQGVMQAFHFLHYGLSAIFVFIGFKMLAGSVLEIPVGLSLGIVGTLILLPLLASLVWPRRGKAAVEAVDCRPEEGGGKSPGERFSGPAS